MADELEREDADCSGHGAPRRGASKRGRLKERSSEPAPSEPSPERAESLDVSSTAAASAEPGATSPEESEAPRSRAAAREAMLARYGRLCSGLEALLESWAAVTVMEDKKDWAMTISAISLAAQRTASLRLMLDGGESPRDEEDDDESTHAKSEAIRRHWEALTGEASGDHGAPA